MYAYKVYSMYRYTYYNRNKNVRYFYIEFWFTVFSSLPSEINLFARSHVGTYFALYSFMTLFCSNFLKVYLHARQILS